MRENDTETIAVVSSAVQRGNADTRRSLERLVISLCVGVLAFGGTAGILPVALGAAAVLIVGLVVLAARKPASDPARDTWKAGAITAGMWLLIAAIVVAGLFFVPADYTLTGGVIVGGVCAALAWATLALA
ncbi:hypothetical protein [Corynebacterium timonense]|uniref:Uncharacterized protein n=1 Tax=Corynebacterium timonense TaxID=441500 RepID=A0A1H1QVL5_9CORY|nr:hypothetical protein [Corynebacterium timonense]SDS27407.1 hypothetical protein SAMN04488539_1349 [Corynebacterium timonense]